MDALSDLLRVVRFSGGLFLEAKFRGPWCVRSRVEPEDVDPAVKDREEIVGFHYILDGRLQVRLGRETPQEVKAGNFILLPHNDAHFLGSDVTLPPREAGPLVRKVGGHGLAGIDFGDEREAGCHFVCGFLATNLQEHPLLTALPPLLVTNVRGRPCAEWVESSFRYAAREFSSRRPGSQEILGRLSELLFVEAVREHIERLPAEAGGWLAALRDPALARALAAMHSRPAHAWTVEELAKQACLSRSAFADRFTSVAGLPPMSYLTRWRMLLARQRLRESADTIAQIAASVGYESESTFSRAFRREMGCAPGAWRRTGQG